MKRKLAALLVIISIACIAVSLILPLTFASEDTAIIGGADVPTYALIYFSGPVWLTVIGAVGVIASAFLLLGKTNRL